MTRRESKKAPFTALYADELLRQNHSSGNIFFGFSGTSSRKQSFFVFLSRLFFLRIPKLHLPEAGIAPFDSPASRGRSGQATASAPVYGRASQPSPLPFTSSFLTSGYSTTVVPVTRSKLLSKESEPAEDDACERLSKESEPAEDDACERLGRQPVRSSEGAKEGYPLHSTSCLQHTILQWNGDKIDNSVLLSTEAP
ncbi:MAG: hypothetical protein UY87_C0078G0008 [Candidatus Peribacteria bacterium GW2011_GWC2_54_8]|nr:MAG: hypothetical protein UY87_C0078G0008 [Candidatus Peribacteria bacterium GW2011_GWC2_54_8]